MKNFIQKTKLKQLFIILLLLTLFVFISAISYVNAVSENIDNSVFRLHVIANSNSTEDQNLKLKVRDTLLSYMNSLIDNNTSKDDAINLAIKYKDDFKKIAQNVIEENGFNYDVEVEIGPSSFPTKYYGDITLPAGIYDALKVRIGKASGENWWCVMFPPLCFVDVSSGIIPESSKEEIKKKLNNEEYELISKKNNSQISFKFKLVEFFQNFRLGNK